MPFLLIGFTCFKAAEMLQRKSLFLTTKSPGDSGIYLINMRRMEDSVKYKDTVL